MTYQPNHHLPAPAPTTKVQGRFPFHRTRLFRPSGPRRDGTLLPSVWWLSILFLGSVSLLMMSWGAYSLTAHPLGKDLREAHASPMLSLVGGEVTARKPGLGDLEPILVAFNDQAPEPLPLPPPVVPEPPPAPDPVKIELPAPPPALPKIDLPAPILDPPVVVAPKTPDQIPVLNGLPQPPELIPPPVVAVQASFPIIAEHLTPFVAMNVNPGETPMIRNWKMVAFYSLFASVISQAPAFAGEKEDIKKVLEKLDKLQKSADDIKDDVKGLKTDVTKLQGDFGGLSSKVGSNTIKIEELENNYKDLKLKLEALASRKGISGDKVSIEEVKAMLSSIEQAILKLTPGEKRVALSPPTTSAGRVVLVSVYGERLMFLLNNKSYVVEPNTTLPIDGVPAGALTYEVRSPTFGVVSRGNTMLNPNDTFTLTAR